MLLLPDTTPTEAPFLQFSPSMLPSFLIFILLAVFLVGLFLFIIDSELIFHLNPRNWFPAKKVPVQIAYKKANLRAGASHFSGVTHTRYHADDEAKYGPGFHAYDTFEQALAHPQEGNVVLEVLLSGKITKMDLGYIATKQRVLQVMPHKCVDYHCTVIPNSFEIDSNGNIFFYCSIHGLPIAGIGLLTRVARFFGGRNGEIRVSPLSKLPDMLPWLGEHKIVVAATKGKDKFIPTIISDQVELKKTGGE